jgi:hypothetical protein
MTAEERESLQKKVVLLHRNWTKDCEYLPPPTIGKLADLDPAVLVTPPKGLEVGQGVVCTGVFGIDFDCRARDLRTALAI